MLDYQFKATTVKTIDQFRYNLYLDISLNMLKYNNDSSAILRILSSLIDTSQDILDDLAYKPKFDLSYLDFITIDRFNGFQLDKIPSLSIVDTDAITRCGEIKGYSRYTDKVYQMKYVKDDKDFVRHSLPCDCLVGDIAFADGYTVVDLPPNTKVDLDIKIENSAVTLSPQKGFTALNLIDSKTATVRLYGVSVTGLPIQEDIVFKDTLDYSSSKEYSFITGAMAIGSTSQISIVLYPYLNGENEKWDCKITDRETFETYESIITVDAEKKSLIFNIYTENVIFPNYIEPYRIVEMDIPSNETIWAHYVDINNKLVYVVTSASKLYCFPVIIPTAYSKDLDDLKTPYQSMRVEYVNDSINRMFTFYVFPSMRTNDIESMSVFINGNEYLGQGARYTDMILDLFRSNIETNRIQIPYSDIFGTEETALVEFRSFGLEESVFPMFLTNIKLKPLYTKNLSNISSFKEDAPENYINPIYTSNNLGYKQFVSGNMSITDQCTLIKLSSVSNVLMNGHRIENIFDTFYFSETDRVLITSDTITQLSGA